MKNEFLFIGFLIPPKEMEEILNIDKYPQIQTYKFITNITKGIEFSEECNFTYLSSRPVSDYPDYPLKYIKGRKFNYKINDKDVSIHEITFINIGIMKIISRFLTTIFRAINIYNKKTNKKGIVVYSVHIPFMAVGYILSLVYNIDFITLWTDPPAVISERDSVFKNLFRRIELSCAKFLMRKSTKIIALTKDLANDFAPQKPTLIIEGVVDVKDANNKIASNLTDGVFKIVYTGSIEQKYGIDNLVNAIKRIHSDFVSLEIYGNGSYEKDLVQLIGQDQNISYHGFIPNEEVINVQRDSNLLINVRPVNESYVKYSFPSKTLEYMLSGVPVLTTRLPGIPSDYFNYVYNIPDNSVETIVNEIKRIINIPNDERRKKAKEAMKYAESKNYINQGKKIIKFINHV